MLLFIRTPTRLDEEDKRGKEACVEEKRGKEVCVLFLLCWSHYVPFVMMKLRHEGNYTISPANYI